MAESAETPARSHRGRWIIVGVVFCGAVSLIAAIAYFSFRLDLSPQECERLESKKNIAVGYLENGSLSPDRPNKLPEADALFEEIGREKPGDPLALRNLAITRLLQVQKINDP